MNSLNFGKHFWMYMSAVIAGPLVLPSAFLRQSHPNQNFRRKFFSRLEHDICWRLFNIFCVKSTVAGHVMTRKGEVLFIIQNDGRLLISELTTKFTAFFGQYLEVLLGIFWCPLSFPIFQSLLGQVLLNALNDFETENLGANFLWLAPMRLLASFFNLTKSFLLIFGGRPCLGKSSTGRPCSYRFMME